MPQETHSAEQHVVGQAEKVKGQVKGLAKSAGRTLLKKLLIFLKPYLLIIAGVLAIFLVVVILIATTYSAMTSQGALAGTNPSPEDEKLRQEYIELTDEANVKEKWLVSGEGEWYPDKGEHVPDAYDRYGKDEELKLKWGTIHSVGLFWAYATGSEEIPAELKKEIASDLRPFFYYKESEVTVTMTSTDSEGNEVSETTSYIVHLLVEANTIYGHFRYKYEWVTETSGNTTTTYERLKDTVTVSRWERLDDYLKTLYGTSKVDDPELNRLMVLEAGEGFTAQEEWLEWLLRDGEYNFVSNFLVPADLMSYFKEAESEYGIPWWFLAAVAFKESSFDPLAENADTGAYGLMQILPDNWEAYAPVLGFDPASDRDNPRAQVLMGAYMLYQMGLEGIDWDGNWKDATLPVLAFYGGFRTDGAVDRAAMERCRVEYAGLIWKIAERLKNVGSTWPVPGYFGISSPFNPQERSDVHPDGHFGTDIPAPEGVDVVSVSSGTVAFSGWHKDDHSQGYGLLVVVTDGVHEYYYGHLSKIGVSNGDAVEPGQKIGEIGSTGHSTGPHLHFGVKENGVWIDPMLLLGR